jgi:hypothetical protein
MLKAYMAIIIGLKKYVWDFYMSYLSPQKICPSHRSRNVLIPTFSVVGGSFAHFFIHREKKCPKLAV